MIISRAPRIKVDGFGFYPDDAREIVWRYTITNRYNASVKLISLGAGLQSLKIPNKNDDITDVTLGFDSIHGYLKNRYIGRIVGRVSNPYTQKSKCNEDPCKFDIVNWNSYILGNQVVMTNVSRNLSEKHPGDLLTQVKYNWTDDNKLHVNIVATSTKPTPVNIAPNFLFNLAGHGMAAKELKNHIVKVNADQWTEIDLAKTIPSGEIKEVYDSVYDLRTPTHLNTKTLFKVPGGGYNHNLCINTPSSLWCYRFHARILHPPSGRTLEVCSNHPTIQIYTGCDLPNPKKIYPPHLDEEKNKNKIIKTERIKGKDGRLYGKAACFGLIPQGFPEALHSENFSSNVLQPGKMYTHNVTYHFGLLDYDLNYCNRFA